MDVSRKEQRVLHALAQGGMIVVLKDDNGKAADYKFYNREGWLITGFTEQMFRKLKAKKAIASSNGRPYRITRRGLELVRSEYDNR